jgi:hypothetical protein
MYSRATGGVYRFGSRLWRFFQSNPTARLKRIWESRNQERFVLNRLRDFETAIPRAA